MGSQQLLIIVLSVFVAGLAIWTGVRLVRSLNQDSERDLVIHQIQVVVSEANKYASKPRNIGGGDGSYVGFDPINLFTNTSRVRIYVTTGSDWILMQGYGGTEGWDGVNPVAVVAQYEMSSRDFSTISNVN